MGIALLILLAIIIAWFVYKAMSNHSSSGAGAAAALRNPENPDNPGTDPNPGSAVAKATETATASASGAAGAVAGGAAIAGAAIAGGAAAIGGQPAHTAGSGESGLFPSTGNLVSDIAEMFKVLNLRASDAPRLSLSAEQYESLKTGDAGGLSDDILAGVMQKLQAMV